MSVQNHSNARWRYQNKRHTRTFGVLFDVKCRYETYKAAGAAQLCFACLDSLIGVSAPWDLARCARIFASILIWITFVWIHFGNRVISICYSWHTFSSLLPEIWQTLRQLTSILSMVGWLNLATLSIILVSHRGQSKHALSFTRIELIERIASCSCAISVCECLIILHL